MKTNFKIFILLVCVYFVGCTKNDDSVHDVQPKELRTKLASDTWNLRNVSGGILGMDASFEKGRVKWSFANQSSILSVENNSADRIYSGLGTGKYSYSIFMEQDRPTIFLKVEDDVFGNISISGNVLTIDQNELDSGLGTDGFVLKLEK